MIDVRLDNWLRRYGSPASDQVDARTVRQVIDVLEGRYPGLRLKLRDETGALRPYVRVFVDGEDVSGTTATATPLDGARTIDILHSIAGG
jgi:sulfur-carrier protein